MTRLTPRIALQLAERYSEDYAWEERNDSTSDADYEDEYDVIDVFEEMDDTGEPVRGRPEDYGLAQVAMFDAVFDAVTTP